MRRARMARLPVLAASAAWVAASGCDAQPRAASTEAHTLPTASTPARPGDEFVRGLVPAAAQAGPDPAGVRPEHPDADPVRVAGESGRWMLTSPNAPVGVPVDREYKFPPEADLDLDRVAVFYTVPNRRPSPTVSLREIIDAREARVLR